MKSSTAHLDRFLSAVHRRLVVLRGLERLGMCVLAGCAVALVLMGVAYWRGRPGGQMGAAALALSAICGVVWAIFSRPTKLTAAIAADRQLRLAELLTTALILRKMGDSSDADAGFRNALLVTADAYAAATSPTAIILNRLGARSWGGIGLAMALVGAMAMLGHDPARSQASVAATGPKSWIDIEDQQGANKGNETRIAAGVDMRRVRPGTGGDDNDPLKSGTAAADQGTETATGGQSTQATGGSAQAGTGAGGGKTDATGSGGGTTPAAGGGTTGGASTKTAGGGTGAATSGSTGDGGNTAGSTGIRHPAPPWRTSGWSEDRAAARLAVRVGQVPDAYRDMVRDYFERD